MSELLKFQPIEKREVCDIVRGISTVAVGADGVGAGMLKLCCPTIIPFITQLTMLVLPRANFLMHGNELWCDLFLKHLIIRALVIAGLSVSAQFFLGSWRG